MSFGWWFFGSLSAACSGLSATHKGLEFITVYLGLLAIGLWLEGIAQVIKGKK